MDNYTEINKSSLVNILTLRYDPSIKPDLHPKTHNDFVFNESSIGIQNIEDIICEEIENKLDLFGDDKLSIALSGGVDSTLALTLFRKIKPQKKIHAISLKFADSIDETPAAANYQRQLV